MCNCVCGGAFLTKTQHSELKKTLLQMEGYTDVDAVIFAHNARINRDIRASKRMAAYITDRTALLEYVRHKAFSPDNEHWAILEDRLIKYSK